VLPGYIDVRYVAFQDYLSYVAGDFFVFRAWIALSYILIYSGAVQTAVRGQHLTYTSSAYRKRLRTSVG
jgi:hypothetical protein